MYKNNNNTKKNSKKSKKGTGLSPKTGSRNMQFALSTASKLINSKVVRDNLGSIKMSSCAAKLAAAVADPFSEEAKGACFPVYPAPDSHKVTALSRFDGMIGSGGLGFIAINASLASDLPSGYYTEDPNFSYANVNILSADSTLNPGVARLYHDGPYTGSDLVSVGGARPTAMGRVVAVGVRVTYTGTTLNESGTISLLAAPGHTNITGFNTGGIQGFSQTNICPFGRKPCTLSLVPTAMNDSEYHSVGEGNSIDLVYPWASDAAFYSSTTRTTASTSVDVLTVGATTFNSAAPFGIIAVTGVAGNEFHADIVFHLEYTGKKVASVCTPNSVDVSSVQAILTAANQLSTRKMAHPNDKPWKLLMDGIRAAMGSPVALTVRGIVRL